MQGYMTGKPQTPLRDMMLGKDARSNQGIYARGNPRQAGMNQNINPDAIRRRLERMQGIGNRTA